MLRQHARLGAISGVAGKRNTVWLACSLQKQCWNASSILRQPGILARGAMTGGCNRLTQTGDLHRQHLQIQRIPLSAKTIEHLENVQPVSRLGVATGEAGNSKTAMVACSSAAWLKPLSTATQLSCHPTRSSLAMAVEIGP